MREASVGFQCPSCVKEGARSTRAAQGVYGGRRSDNPMSTSVALIAVNALVWLLITATGGNGGWATDWLALFPVGVASPLYTGLPIGAWWQPLTSAFTHVQVWHLAMNMIALYLLGPALEGVVGRTRFLAIYLLSALGGSAAVMWLSDPLSLTVGASGAIYGILAALLVVVIRRRGDTRQLLTLIVLNVALTAFGYTFISWQAHLGGFVAGLLATAAVVWAPRTRRTSWQAVGLGVVAVLCVGLIVVAALAIAPAQPVT